METCRNCGRQFPNSLDPQLVLVVRHWFNRGADWEDCSDTLWCRACAETLTEGQARVRLGMSRQQWLELQKRLDSAA